MNSNNKIYKNEVLNKNDFNINGKDKNYINNNNKNENKKEINLLLHNRLHKNKAIRKNNINKQDIKRGNTPNNLNRNIIITIIIILNV